MRLELQYLDGKVQLNQGNMLFSADVNVTLHEYQHIHYYYIQQFINLMSIKICSCWRKRTSTITNACTHTCTHIYIKLQIKLSHVSTRMQTVEHNKTVFDTFILVLHWLCLVQMFSSIATRTTMITSHLHGNQIPANSTWCNYIDRRTYVAVSCRNRRLFRCIFSAFEALFC